MTKSIKLALLLVEDCENNQELYQNLLNDYFDIVITSNGRAAIELLPQLAKLPDIILMDKKMPILDGISATAELKQDHKYRKIPVVIFTSSPEPQDEELAIQAGAISFINKAISRNALIQHLFSCIKIKNDE